MDKDEVEKVVDEFLRELKRADVSDSEVPEELNRAIEEYYKLFSSILSKGQVVSENKDKITVEWPIKDIGQVAFHLSKIILAVLNIGALIKDRPHYHAVSVGKIEEVFEKCKLWSE